MSIWWKHVGVMKIHSLDEIFSMWWKVLTCMTMMKIDKPNENFSSGWKFITLMKMDQCDESLFMW